MNYKVNETTTHVFFLTGPFSNWHITPFQGRLEQDGPMLSFNCTEQYLMASKAHLFSDQTSLDKILAAAHPRTQKELGRSVGNFTKEHWEEHAGPIWIRQALDIMVRGCWYKYQQNDEYRAEMRRCSGKYIVEGNPKDTIWAVGLAWDDPAIQDPANWKGSNLLGEAHMQVQRDHADLMVIRSVAENVGREMKFNIWTKRIEVA